MAVYETIQTVAENIDTMTVLGGLSWLLGLAIGYKTITSFNKEPGMTRVPVQDAAGNQLVDGAGNPVFQYTDPYRPGLALRKQKLGFYAGLIAALAFITAGTAAAYEGVTESYL